MVNNGGSAFPISYSPSYPNEIVGGMTLRDYFAAKAMEAMIIKGMEDTKRGINGVGFIVEYAYEYADAMIKQRNKQGV